MLAGYLTVGSSGLLCGASGFPAASGAFGRLCVSGGCAFGDSGNRDFVIHFGYAKAGGYSSVGAGASVVPIHQGGWLICVGNCRFLASGEIQVVGQSHSEHKSNFRSTSPATER